MSRLFTAVIALSGITLLAGCMGPQPKPNDPYYAPVLPRTPLPAAANNGSIYQAGFEQNLYGDRKAFRIGDIITITLNEKTAASKTANSKIAKTSSTTMGITSLFGSSVHAGDANLNAGYSGDRATNGNSQAAQGNSLTGSVTVTVADVLPNGILAVRGEKWMTLNTGEELVRIAGMVRADDIATDNTVSSNRVADARITYSGTGSFADASQTGWLDRFFLSPYWPF